MNSPFESPRDFPVAAGTPDALTRDEAYQFIRVRQFAVISTTMQNGWPESALVAVAATPELEIILDTNESTRKCANMRRDPRVSLVIGWRGDHVLHIGGYQTIQYCGIADEPEGAERKRLVEIYFAAHPDAHSRAGTRGLTYFRIRPRWLRYSTYYPPRAIAELSLNVPSAGTG